MSTATQIRERPILFSDRLVRAILDGRKTQTRRVVRPRLAEWLNFFDCDDARDAEVKYLDDGYAGPGWYAWCGEYPDEGSACLGKCPYGEPGDRLWVREAWGTVRMHELGQHIFGDGPIPDRDEIVYRAGRPVIRHEPGKEPYRTWSEDYQPKRWRPSIHMPREASRITLEVVSVRVERLQEISAHDVWAEGVGPGETIHTDVAREWFCQSWDRINGKRTGCDWHSNPWVWVIEFRMLAPTLVVEGNLREGS